MNAGSPTITIALPDFLFYLWEKDIKDWSEVKRELGLVLHLLDPDERYCHVELEDNSAVVWKPRAWRETYERYLREKARSEADRQARYLRDAQRAALVKAVNELTGLGAEHPDVIRIAYAIVHTHNVNGAKGFGVDLEAIQAD